jgi:ATP-binding cassette subfamily F protein 1
VRSYAWAGALEACSLDEDAESGNGMRGRLAVEQARKEAGEIDADNFDLSEELNKTYTRLDEKGDATAEARASKILHGRAVQAECS